LRRLKVITIPDNFVLTSALLLVKRIVLVRPPGSRGKEIALSLAEYLSENGNFTCISVGDLVDKEISKRSAFGKEIE
jgi:adenylate kinase